VDINCVACEDSRRAWRHVIHHPAVTRLAYAVERRVPALGRHGVTALMVEIGLLFVVLAARDLAGLIVGTGATVLPALVRIVRDESEHRREAALAATADLRIAGDARQLMHMPMQLRDLAFYLADWEPTTLAKLAESSRTGTLQQTIAIGPEGHALERALDQRWNWFANATSPYLPTASRRARALVHDALDALAKAFQVTGALNMLSGSMADARRRGQLEPEHGAELLEASWLQLGRWINSCAAAADALDFTFDRAGAEGAARARADAVAARVVTEARALAALIANGRAAIAEIDLDAAGGDLEELRRPVQRALDIARGVSNEAFAEATSDARTAHRALSATLTEASAAVDVDALRTCLAKLLSDLARLQSLRTPRGSDV